MNPLSNTSGMDTNQIGLAVDKFVFMVKNQRKPFERKWYDNNFFDDGYHFRYVSRTTGRIVDTTEKNASFAPNRAIPKASRQIRGVANLLLGPEWTPAIYPNPVSQATYPNPQEYQKQLYRNKEQALKVGHWIEQEWKDQDIKQKMIQMLILAAKHGVSYMQIWPDAVEEKIRTKVYDAFDVYVLGNGDEIYDSPMLVKGVPQLISEIKANEYFDKEQLKLISPDNKYASSEIKQAYMQVRFGAGIPSDNASTLILKEAFIKEYLTADNAVKVATDLGESAKSLKKGDVVIRHVFVAGEVWLYDKYENLKRYPFVDYRFEPGNIFQTPLIERFIPANKSLDIIMSRIERWMNTMTVGLFMKRKGENFDITNTSAAQTIEYESVPPTQLPMTNFPSSAFNFIDILEKNIEEQGASTSALNILPDGVKSGVAIESVKSTEYANLKIPTDMLKKCVKRITERMVEIAADYFISPQTVYHTEGGDPKYYEIMGEAGTKARSNAKMDPSNAIVINRDLRVDIEIEPGMGFTQAGKKDTMQQIITFMTQLMQQGVLTQDAVKVVVNKFLETYSFGSTQEFMEALNSGTQAAPLTEEQIQQMKVAVLETLNDAGVVGPQADQKLVQSTKVGVLESLQESGIVDKINQSTTPQEPAKESVSIAYKDMPEDVKRQAEAKAGFTPSQLISPAGTDQAVKHNAVINPPEPKIGGKGESK